MAVLFLQLPQNINNEIITDFFISIDDVLELGIVADFEGQYSTKVDSR